MVQLGMIVGIAVAAVVGVCLGFFAAFNILGMTDARVYLLTCAGAVLGMGTVISLMVSDHPQRRRM